MVLNIPFLVRYYARNVDKKKPRALSEFTTCITAESVAAARKKLTELKRWHAKRNGWKYTSVPKSELIPVGAC